MKNYMVREFDRKKDLDAAYKCFASGFYNIMWPIIDEAEEGFIKDIILSMSDMGDRTYVAVADGEARGILVGTFSYEWKTLHRKAKALATFSYKLITRSYKMSPYARKSFWRVLYGYLPFLYLHTLTPSETLLLTSHADYRGGIGKAMMNAWIAETRGRNYGSSTVCTDSELNWQFYERYGFKRIKEFDSKAYGYSLPGRTVNGYIYHIDLE